MMVLLSVLSLLRVSNALTLKYSVLQDQQVPSSVGSCYTVTSTWEHNLICNAAESSCPALEWNMFRPETVLQKWYEPGYISRYGDCAGCCHCAGSCDHSKETNANCDALECYHDPVGVTDDPHITNLQGERFYIYQEGWLPVATVPPQDESPKLKIEGLISKVTNMTFCGDLYMTGVHITGSWISKPISFFQSPNMVIKLGETQLSTGAAAQELYHDEAGLKISRNATDRGAKFLIEIPRPEGDVRLKVEYIDSTLSTAVAWAGEGDKSSKYFNLAVQGLETYMTTLGVGGVLGLAKKDMGAWTTWIPSDKCKEDFFLGSPVKRQHFNIAATHDQ